MLDKYSTFEKYDKLRAEKGLKDTDVARLSNVDQSTISNWRKGHYMPKLDKLSRIAAVLGTSVTYFMEESGKDASKIKG